MATNVTLIPGDGIGPEIAESVKQIFAKADVDINFEVMPAGEDSLGKHGSLLPEITIKNLKANKIGLKGPTTTPVGGGHRSVNVDMRQRFELYANIRPVRTIPGMKNLHAGVDMIIVRENTEDLYKGVEYKIGNGIAHGIKIITADASLRIGRYAFEMARKLGRKKVSAVHKANIMKLTDGLFLDCIRAVAAEFKDIEYNEVIVDNCCMQLVTKPQQFDVIVTENLYGDILSDLASGLIGGLGVAAGANIGQGMAIFEAVHGSAPDIAGKGIANPTALILSGVMMLEYLGDLENAGRIREAVFKTLTDPQLCTRDIGGNCSTARFTENVIGKL